MITINGIEFEPRADCASLYKYDYVLTAQRLKEGYTEPDTGVKWDERGVWRKIIKTDLWFIVYFVMGVKIANHPFAVKACRDIEEGPADFTLDVYAREHFKSTIITKAETIQYALNNPEKSTGIFSYVRPLAKKFLFEIKETFQTSRILHACFPDVVWNDPERDAPMWSLDDGLILKRQTNMSEPTVSAWGLTEGMPIGMHFDRRVYDDISTEDMAESVDMMEKVKTKFDSSQNIGKDGGTHRVIGTFYHHNDPLVYIRGKKDMETEAPLYFLRLKPATQDGRANSPPVFLTEKRLKDLKATRTFNCQQLCNPTPEASQRLNPDFLNRVDPKFIPKDLYRIILVDQAGDLASNVKKEGGDAWAVGVIGIEPAKDDIGQSRVFIEDLWIQPASESEAIDQIVRMFMRSGIVHKLGVEKVGISTTHIHIAAALKSRGRQVDFGDSKWSVGVMLRPAGRNKQKFIESSLAWPLNNGKIFYSTDIPNADIMRLKLEMNNFPFWHDDAMNMLSYTYDVIKDSKFDYSGIGRKVRSVTEVMDSMPQASGSH